MRERESGRRGRETEGKWGGRERGEREVKGEEGEGGEGGRGVGREWGGGKGRWGGGGGRGKGKGKGDVKREGEEVRSCVYWMQ
jgi:hypothetical protein